MIRTKAFTLIELLVVVAIIAVLVAILLPALSHARDQAEMIACLSVQKQMATATVLYMDEYGGCVPMPIRYENGGWPEWSSLLVVYFPDGIPQDPGAVGEMDPRWPQQVHGYGMNAYWIKRNTNYAENKDHHPSEVTDHSKEVVYCCNRGMWSVGPLLDIYDPSVHPGFWGGGNDLEAARCRMAARHLDSSNVVFLDMHAEHIPFDLAKEWSEWWITRNWWPAPYCWLPEWD